MDLKRIQNLTKQLLQAEGCSEETEVSIVLTHDIEISQLNKDYRGIDGPTDVLSFAQREGDDDFAGDPEDNILGDIVVSVDTAERQAEQQGHSLDEEIDVLIAHGILHLLGYDHAEPEDAKKMFEIQDEIIEKFRAT